MEIEWISRSEWEALLVRSRSLTASAKRADQMGQSDVAKHLWREIAPLNRRINSPLLKVRGIDDRAPPWPPKIPKLCASVGRGDKGDL